MVLDGFGWVWMVLDEFGWVWMGLHGLICVLVGLDARLPAFDNNRIHLAEEPYFLGALSGKLFFKEKLYPFRGVNFFY